MKLGIILQKQFLFIFFDLLIFLVVSQELYVRILVIN